MTHDQFRATVAAMRDAQKAYFDTHDRQQLNLANKLERQVDAMLSFACVSPGDNENTLPFESRNTLAKRHYQELDTINDCLQVALRAGDAPEVRAQLETYRAEVIERLINTAEVLP